MGDRTSSRPAPTANGTLAKTPVLHLLVYGLDRQMSGTLEFIAPDRRKAAVLFATGQPAKVRTSEPVAYLGRVLLELGHLSETQLTDSLAELAQAKASTTMLHGTILLARGFVDVGQLRAGLAEQVARKLRYVASMPPDTVYAYYDSVDVLRGWGGEGERVDPVPLLWPMLREYPPWDRVNPALAGIAASALRLAGTANLDRLALGKDERAAAELLRVRPMRVAELPRAGQLNDRTAQLLAYLLLATKQVEVVAPPAAPAASVASALRLSRTPFPGTRSSANWQAAAPARPPSSGKHAAVKAPTTSSAPQPPSNPSVSTTGVASSRPNIPTVSSNPPSRPSGSSIASAVSRQSTPSMPAVTPSSSSPKVSIPAAPSVPPPPPPNLAPELLERWKEVVDRAATIDRADYFMMLDLARDASRADIENAFFALVKRWHPDRLPPELAPIRDPCARVFGRMSEAHATLTDEAKRTTYMKLLADGSGSPETQATLAKVVEAATNFQKAEVCFRRNDLKQAEIFCRRALEDDNTQPDYHAMLAWLESLKPENQTTEKAVASIQALERAIALSDRCEKAYFWRGLLFKRIGKMENAVRDFRRAAELNPRNIDAVREVRLYHMRGGRRSSGPPERRSTPAPFKPGGEEPARPGLFERFFKKS